MRYASGNVYDGEWADNVKSGKGVMVWSDLRERYEGEWLAGKQHGHGEHTWLRLHRRKSRRRRGATTAPPAPLPPKTTHPKPCPRAPRRPQKKSSSYLSA